LCSHEDWCEKCSPAKTVGARTSDGCRGAQPSVPELLLNAQRQIPGAGAHCAQSMSESLVSTVMRVAFTSPTMWTRRLPDVSYWLIEKVPE